MKKLLAILVILVAILAGGYLYSKKYLNTDPKFLIEQSLPPSKEITEYFPQGKDLDFPLNVPEGYRLGIFADLNGKLPRVLALDPNGVLFASLTSAGKVIALPDKNSDGQADEVIEVLSGLNRPHGMAFSGGKFYLAETDRVATFDYDSKSLKANNPRTIFTLPSGGRHFTRTIKVYEDKLYTAVGSSCDTCVEENRRRAAILVSDLQGNDLKIFAKGLRNTVFFAVDKDGRIWGNDMGRDFLGDNLPPDELNIIKENGNYGWPYCYGNKILDSKFASDGSSETCANTEGTAFDYPAHVAPLGLAIIDSKMFPKEEQEYILSSFHGSWNRTSPIGYKVVKLKVENGRAVESEDFITGWLTQDREVLGRPVDLIFGPNGELYISDDKAGLIYTLTKEL